MESSLAEKNPKRKTHHHLHHRYQVAHLPNIWRQTSSVKDQNYPPASPPVVQKLDAMIQHAGGVIWSFNNNNYPPPFSLSSSLPPVFPLQQLKMNGNAQPPLLPKPTFSSLPWHFRGRSLTPSEQQPSSKFLCKTRSGEVKMYGDPRKQHDKSNGNTSRKVRTGNSSSSNNNNNNKHLLWVGRSNDTKDGGCLAVDHGDEEVAVGPNKQDLKEGFGEVKIYANSGRRHEKTNGNTPRKVRANDEEDKNNKELLWDGGSNCTKEGGGYLVVDDDDKLVSRLDQRDQETKFGKVNIYSLEKQDSKTSNNSTPRKMRTENNNNSNNNNKQLLWVGGSNGTKDGDGLTVANWAGPNPKGMGPTVVVDLDREVANHEEIKMEFSGVFFNLSPPPSSLPLPKFSLSRKPNNKLVTSCNAQAATGEIDAGATDNLRRLLKLR